MGLRDLGPFVDCTVSYRKPSAVMSLTQTVILSIITIVVIFCALPSYEVIAEWLL